MTEEAEKIILVDATFEEGSSSQHIPSKINPDTLFHFAKKVEYIIPEIKAKKLYPRYCKEDISYLHIDGLKNISYPMKCFCDINLHKLSEHVAWYGCCGIALSKEWGIKSGIQPLHYINENSALRQDLTTAFLAAIRSDSEDENIQNLKDYIAHELMFSKPYSGMMYNSFAEKEQVKCFTDEQEWRYIPDLSKTNLPQIITDVDKISYEERTQNYTNALNKKTDTAISFEYNDLRYIIVKSVEDSEKMIAAIMNLDIEEIEKYKLTSKILIWEISKGDF